MKNLKVLLVVALGVVLFSSCSKGYGCFYSSNDQQLSPEVTPKVITVEPTSQDAHTVAITR